MWVRVRWFVLAVLLVAGSLTAWAQTGTAQDDDGGGFLERLIEDNLSSAGRDVRIQGFRGALSSEASLDELTIADENGVWLTLRGATLDWSRASLLRGRLQVNELTAEEIILPRLPAADQSANVPAPEAAPFSLPDLPVSVNIDKVAAQRVELGEPLFGAAAVVSLEGSVSLADGDGEALISVERIDGKEGSLKLDASFANETRQLKVDLALQEGADGIAANLLDIPGKPSLSLTVQGEGPLSDFAADIALATDGQDRLSGRVAVTQSGEGDAATTGFNVDLGGDIAPVFAPQFRPFFGPDIQLQARGQTQAGGGFVLDTLDLSARALQLQGQVSVGADGLPDKIDVTGEIASPDGSPVQLPVGGEVKVGRLGLSVQFDASQSEDWTSEITLSNLDLATLDVADATLRATGRIAVEEGQRKVVTGDVTFRASGLDAADPGVAQALGDSVEGSVGITWATGAPVEINDLTIDGASFALAGEGRVDATGDDGTVVALNAKLNADDFAAFSVLAGRNLAGSGELQVGAQVMPLSGGFDVTLNGTVNDLQVDQPQADALLAGRTDIVLRADRDETGTRLRTLTLENPALDVDASADLTSVASNLRANVRIGDTSVLESRLSGPAAVVVVARQEGETWDYDVQGTAPGVELTATGQASNLSEPVKRITTETSLSAEDIGRFSGLAGRDLAGSADLTLSGFVTTDLRQADMKVDGTVNDLAIGDPRIDPILVGRTALSTRVLRDGPSVTVDRLDLDAQGIGLTAQGSGAVEGLGVESPLISADLTLSADSLAPFSALAGRDLGGSVDAKVLGSARLDYSEGDVSLTVTGRDVATGIEALDPVLRGLVELKGDVKREGETLTVEGLDLTAEAPGLRLQGSGSASDLTGTPLVTADATVSADGLSVFSGLAQRQLAGALDATVNGSARIDGTEADLKVKATGRGLQSGMESIDPILTGLVDIDADVARNGDTATIRRLSVTADGPGLVLNGTGSASDLSGTPLVQADATMRVGDLSAFSGLAGRQLAGSVEADVNGSARIDGSEADLTVKATGRSLEAGMDSIDPLLSGLVDIDADVQRSADTITVSRLNLRADGPGLRVNGSGSATGLTGSAPKVTADAALAVDDLSAFSGLAGRDLGGALDVTVKGEAQTDLSVLDVTLDGTARELKVGQENADRLLRGVTEIGLTARREGEAIDLSRLRIVNPQITATADGRYDKGQSALKADITIADLRDVDPRMQGSANLNLFAEETGEVWQVSLDGEGAGAMVDVVAEVRDALSGNPTVDGTAKVSAEDLSRFRPLVNLPLAGSVNADVQGSVRADLSVFDLTAAVTGNNVRTGIAQADQLLGSRVTANLAARREGADRPIVVRTLDVRTGQLTLNADGQLLGSGNDLNFDARLADVGLFVPGFNGPVTAQGRVSQSGGNLGLNVTGTGPGGIRLRADGTVAQDFSRANIDLTGSAPLGLADQFIQPNSVAGTLNFDVAVNGPLALSSVSGTVTADGARAVVPAQGIVLENISLRGDLGGNALRLNVQAAKQGGGQLTVTGPISLGSGFNADLTIALNGLVVEDPRLYRTTVDGTVTVQGPLAGGARIGGVLRLGQTEVRIPSTGLGATGPIPDGLVHVNEPAAVRATRARAGLLDTDGNGSGGGGSGGGAAYPLDITIVAENRIFVRGRGLDVELGGTLQLGGTTANVIPSGQFDLIRGRLDLLGKRLTMTEGRIVLQGDFTPYIRLVASTEAGDTTVLIVVEGEAMAPGISFRSQPELPEDEVLARLLFGKSISSISPLQAAQLASAVATLAGKGGGGIVNRLRGNFGLDDLDITTDSEGNAGVRAGKYLTENLYTDVTVESGGDARINLNLDLTDSLKLKGGTGSDGDTSVGIFFEKDY
ncbi:translocation/assembly module TamB domain-containing protein [Oceaniglobus roseus]|uniref:translocation/assembly module TamB domain-containing protein n=1 Tax=Oceaniglobus roseus TaxID=1737570 RepID=UPI000C7F757C|nr:translocation/assembly module TamB domain-containing protein [Kandeliimicrobium roseum]